MELDFLQGRTKLDCSHSFLIKDMQIALLQPSQGHCSASEAFKRTQYGACRDGWALLNSK